MKVKIGLIILLCLTISPTFLATDVTELTEQQQKLKTQIDEVNEKILKYEDEANELQKEISANKKKISELEAKQESNQNNITQSIDDMSSSLQLMQKVNNQYSLAVYFYDEDTLDNNYFLKLENVNLLVSSLGSQLTDFANEIEGTEQEIAEIEQLTAENKEKQKQLDSDLEKQTELETNLKKQLAEVQDEIGEIALETNGDVSANKEAIMSAAGVPESQYQYADYIIKRESGWDPTAANPVSSAYGLCQALPGKKMASSGSDWQTNAVTQMKWCNGYATSRYGSWEKAYNFWITNHWW